jgi:small-conductance mechanosensitive channel
MSDSLYCHNLKTVKPVVLLVLLACLLFPQRAFTMEAPVDEKTPAVQERTFPGYNEVIPQATSVAARIAEAEAHVQQAANLDESYAKLDEKIEILKNLEERYSPWEEIDVWQFNRLLSARINYNDLAEQHQVPLENINAHLKNLEELRNRWEQEENYWIEWQAFLRKTDVKLPSETFIRTLDNIDGLLKHITKVGGKLVKAQQKYSPAQEIVASRLSLLNKTMDDLRSDAFRRNAHSLFEADFYRQFNQNLFTGFVHGLAAEIHLPDGFLKRHAWTLALQFICIIIILTVLNYRKKQSKALTEEWSFLYRRPLSGAVFTTMTGTALLGNPYTNAPLVWMLLVGVVLVIAGIRLLDVIYPQQQTRRVIRIIATLFILTETLQVFGLPTPLLQIIQVFLCAAVTMACWLLIRKRRQKDEKLWFGIYLGGSVAVVAMITATLGFATMATNLIDATLSSFVIIIILKMILRLSDGGIHAFISSEWVKSRKFTQTLGIEEATQKLQTLMRIIVLVNTGLYFLVIWQVFDSQAEARESFLNYQYSFGEFTLSVNMVVMVVVVLYLTTLISWVIQAVAESQFMTPRKMDVGVKESLKRLTHYGLFTIGFLVAVSMAGLDLQKFTIMAGALGVGIGFGLQNIVSNFVSGLILLFERPVKIGDTINIGNEWGTISRIGLRSTVFETFDRSEIIVPNADLVSQQVTNWTFSSKVVRVKLPVGVAYGSPLEKVLKILNQAAREHPDVLSYPEANTIFECFGNSSIDFTLRFWVHSIDDRMKVRSEVAVIVDRLFREEKITIPFPQQDLHLRSIDSNLQAQFGVQSMHAQPPSEETAIKTKDGSTE